MRLPHTYHKTATLPSDRHIPKCIEISYRNFNASKMWPQGSNKALTTSDN